MKKKICYICNREVIPSLEIKGTSYEPKKRLFSDKFKIVDKPLNIFLCSKCVETIKALTVNNIAVKTSDIMRD